MTFMVSSTSMAACLNNFHFEDGDFITNIAENGNEIIFYGKTTSASVIVEPMENDRLWPMQDHRWDWVKGLLNLVPEQPVIITITPINVNVIFQY